MEAIIVDCRLFEANIKSAFNPSSYAMSGK